MRKIIQPLLAIAFGAYGLVTSAHGQTTAISTGTTTATSLSVQSSAMDKLAINKGQTLVADKNASSFITLAGSKDNALALVNGLRNGTAITLATASTTTATTATTAITGGTGTIITPPTGKMGWGNVFISLALAQKVLTQAGITNPTAAQLKIALMGGDLIGADGKTVTVKGVLQLRADGMGWGKIAQVYGTKLGPVVSDIKSANKQIARASTTPVTSTGGKAATAQTAARATGKTTLATGTGVTTAGGTPAGSVGAKGLATANGSIPAGKGAGIVTATSGAGNGHTNTSGKGVVSAVGSPAPGVSAAAAGMRGAGAGLVTATGVAAINASTGLNTAQGNVGHGNANGKGKGG